MALFSQPTARALAILDLLMANPHQAFGLTEMTRRLNLHYLRVIDHNVRFFSGLYFVRHFGLPFVRTGGSLATVPGRW